jgi:hypothetical protein
MNTMQNKWTIAAISGLAVLLVGCASSGYKQADKTGAGIAEFRTAIVDGKKAIDATMVSLGKIAETADTDPRPAFEQFTKDLANLDKTSARVKSCSQKVQDQGEAYFKQWEQQLSEVSNKDIRDLAAKRKAKLQETFANIRQAATPLREQFNPWMSDLKDLQKYLSNDLTVSGVSTAKKLFASAAKNGAEVQKSMDALIAELNDVAATLTPAKMAPPEPKAAEEKK